MINRAWAFGAVLVCAPATARADPPVLAASASDAERRAWVDRRIDKGSFVETDMDADRAYFYDPATFERQPDGNVVGRVRAELFRPRTVGGVTVRSVRKLVEIDCTTLRYKERVVEGFAGSNLDRPVAGLPVSAAWTPAATAGSAAGRRLFPACANVAGFARDRAGRFATVNAARPPQAATIADVKARTEAMVASAGPLGSVEQPPVVWRVGTTPTLVFDLAFGPRMVIIPAGEFTMGPAVASGPRRRVRFDKPLAVSMFPITYSEYSWFVAETRRATTPACTTLQGGRFRKNAGRDWFNPGFAQVGRSPATCVGYDDALAYAAWLSRKTGATYRLLTEAEYEYANRAGAATAYWWGDDPNGGCALVNGFDQNAKANAPSLTASACRDPHAFTGALDTSKFNPWGLYDTTGNVASWTADCWERTAARNCRARAVRGGSWASPPDGLLAAARARMSAKDAASYLGFRLAREL